MTLNGVMALTLRYLTKFVYDVVVKQLLGLSRDQNLLLIFCVTILLRSMRDYTAIILAKQEEAMASTSDGSCLRPCLPMSFL